MSGRRLYDICEHKVVHFGLDMKLMPVQMKKKKKKENEMEKKAMEILVFTFVFANTVKKDIYIIIQFVIHL